MYFERLKDEVKAGRTLRSSTERAFTRAFRTILAADISSFIGATVLFLLTVGPVRGFAFFLGHLHDPRRDRRLVLHPADGGPPRLEPASSPSSAARAWPGAWRSRRPVAAPDRRRAMTEPDGADAALDLHAALPRRDAHPVRRHALKRWAIVSGVIIVLGLLSLWQRGLNLGIDFEGGIVWEVPAGDVSVAEAQDALADDGLDGLTVQTLTAERRGAAPRRGRAARRRRRRPRTISAGAGRAHRLRHRGREPQRRRAVVGRGDQPQGPPRPRGLPHRSSRSTSRCASSSAWRSPPSSR